MPKISRIREAAVAWVAVFALAPPCFVSAKDWPHLRGPSLDGISTETAIADAWPADGPPVLWVRDIHQGYSGMTIAGDSLFTQTQSLWGQYLVCLDVHTGTERWRYRYGWPWQPTSVYPGPYATPTWHAGHVYYCAPDGLAGCVNAQDGKPIWTMNVLKKFGGRGCEFGYACSPLVEDGKVILPVGGAGASVVALNADNGETVWTSGDDPASYCPALAVNFRGQRLVIAFLRNSLIGIDLGSGRQLWKQACSEEYDEHSAWPLYAEPDLLISSPFRAGSEMFRLEGPTGRLALSRRWSSRELSNDICSSVLLGGCVYGFDLKDFQAKAHRPSKGQFKCLDFATGRVRWTTERTGHSNVIAADGKLILLNDTGTLILARASPRAYEELARAEVLTGGLCWTAPALLSGRLFVRNQSRIACIFVGRPELLAKEERQRALPAAELPKVRTIDWVAILGREPEYPFDAPTPRELGVWFAYCVLGVFGSASVLAVCIYGLIRVRWRESAGRCGRVVFWMSSFIIGLAGTSMFSRLQGAFVLTWPASLFVVYELTLLTIVGTEQQPPGQRRRWRSRLVVLGFLSLCVGYYELCKVAGAVPAWRFLIGFLPAWPLAVVAARRAHAKGKPLNQLLWLAGAFSVYFWASGLATAWR